MQWDSQAAFPAVYEELLVPGFFTAFANELLDRSDLQDGERLLDVATGTGIVLRLARARRPRLARLTGLDLMPGMLAVAEVKTAGLDVELVQGDAGALPFDDGAFDVVTCQQGVQFFPDRAAALREFRRVLAPGGRVVVSCWGPVESSPGHAVLAQIAEQHVPESGKAARAPYGFPDAGALRDLVTAAGFGDVEVETVAGAAEFASPEDFTRAFMEGSPMALAVAVLSPEERADLLREIAAAIRARYGEPVSAPMETNIATARA